MGFILRLRSILFLSVIPALAALLLWSYHRGVISCETKILQNQIRGVEIHGRIENETLSLADRELDKRLSKWLRD